MMKRIIVIFLSLCSMAQVQAQQEGPDVRRGNKQYNDSNYVEAEVNYRRGLEKNNQSFEGHYNLGNSLFKQGKYAEAAEQYQVAASLLAKDLEMDETELGEKKAASYHNLGNAYYAQQQYAMAVEAYKESLRYNPKDDETRYNLLKAMEQKSKQDQQPHPQPEQQQEQKNDSTQQQQQEQQQQEQQQNQQQEQNQDQMDRETAEQILQALEQDEQDTQDKRQIRQSKKSSLEKNW